MQASLLCKTQVPPSGHMAHSERLTPACMPTTPTKEYQEHCVLLLLLSSEGNLTLHKIQFFHFMDETPGEQTEDKQP